MGKSEAAAKTAMEEIVAKAPEEKRERARQLVESMRSADKTAIERHAEGQIAAQANATNADPKKNILLEEMNKLKEGGTSVLGRLGSKEGMHGEMTNQTSVLKEIRDLLKDGDDPVKNKKDKE